MTLSGESTRRSHDLEGQKSISKVDVCLFEAALLLEKMGRSTDQTNTADHTHDEHLRGYFTTQHTDSEVAQTTPLTKEQREEPHEYIGFGD